MYKTIVFAVSFVIFSNDVSADVTSKFAKVEFDPQHGDIVYIDMDNDNVTACSNNGAGYDYSFDSSTNIGNKIFSVLLAAQRSSSVVKIHGSGVCLNANT